ncbi:MAG: pgaC [Bacillales bacterium]|nr:pgaC [Bacillales bacterium]
MLRFGGEYLLDIVVSFVFWYPIILGISWGVNATIFYIRREKSAPLPLNETPFVSILVPCYNEEKIIKSTIKKLSELDYPDYEIIVINDGSTDSTVTIVKELLRKHNRLRLIDQMRNLGKANALKLGLIAAKGEILVCVDADAYLEKKSLNYIIPHFTTPNNSERVGAVIFNPRVLNKQTIFGKIQSIEHIGIISMIKRAQRILGKIITVSGIATAYRKRAIIDSGVWDTKMLCEDTDIAWSLQRRHWDIRFEPRAVAWTLVPMTIFSIVKQRFRWATGVIQALLKNVNILKSYKQCRLYLVCLEQFLTIIWSCFWIIVLTFYIFDESLRNQYFTTFIWISAYTTISLIIFIVSGLIIDRVYEKKTTKDILFAGILPLIYVYMGAITIFFAIPNTFLHKRKGKPIWNTIDRFTSKHIFKRGIELGVIIISSIIILFSIINFFLSLILWTISPEVIFNNQIIKDAINLTAFTFSTTIDIVYLVVFIGVLWGIYNKKKYGKRRYREFPVKTTIKDIVTTFNIEDEVINTFKGRLVTVEQNIFNKQ